MNMVNIVECKGRPHIFNTWSLSPKRSFQNVMCKSQDIDWQNAKDVSRSQLSSIKWSHLMWVCSYSPLLELTTIKLRNQHLFLQYFYIGVLLSSMVMILVDWVKFRQICHIKPDHTLGEFQFLREGLPRKESTCTRNQ